MKIKTIILIFACLLISVVFSTLFSYSSGIIQYDVIFGALITLFSVSLAIIALLITVLEKYKEKIPDENIWIEGASKILTQISHNTIALLVLIISLALSSIFEPLLIKIPKINIMTTILLFCLILSLISMLDTTISILLLVTHIKDLLSNKSSMDLFLSKKEEDLVNAYRFLNAEHKKSFEDTLKGLTTNQQVESMKKMH